MESLSPGRPWYPEAELTLCAAAIQVVVKAEGEDDRRENVRLTRTRRSGDLRRGVRGLSAIHGLTRAGLRVTLVDAHLYSTFQPLLYQVATGGLNPGDVAYPVGGFTGKRHARLPPRRARRD